MAGSIVALGDRVREFVSHARSSVVLVAPFIKRDPLDRLLTAIGPDVSVSCYTRWRHEEIAAGISDLEVWPTLRARGGSLRLRYDLHAKVYKADEMCLVGSANLTLAALGWTPTSNLELLVPIMLNEEDVAAFFRELDERSIEVTDAIHAEMVEVVSSLASSSAPSADRREDGPLVGWVPRCRVPGNHNLYRTYSQQWNMVNQTTYADAAEDLAALGVPAGIHSESVFMKYVASLLRQSPVTAVVAARAKDAIRPDAGQRLVAYELGYGNGPHGEATGEEWSTLRAWLTAFLGDEFRERHGDSGPELVRGMKIA